MKIGDLKIVTLHHYRLYSPGWVLVSSSKCRQRTLSWATASQILQPSFLASSSTPSILLDFGQEAFFDFQDLSTIFLANSFLSFLTTCPAHLSLLHFIALTIFVLLWSSTLLHLALVNVINFTSQTATNLRNRQVVLQNLLWFYINGCPTRCNTKQSIYYSASSLYMFQVSTTPIIRSTQNCNYSLRYWSYFLCSYLPPTWPTGHVEGR